MFERFSVPARRSIFFALREAKGLGSARIDTVHLLLGVLREDRSIAAEVGAGAFDTIRKELEQVAPPKGERVSTAEDLPLSKKAQRALTYAVEEADALHHKQINAPHLILGLLRIEECTAAKLLRAYGMDHDRYRETLRENSSDPPLDPEPVASRETLLEEVIYDLRQLVENAALGLRKRPDPYGDEQLRYKPWTRKEALGHLIDWAIAHERWVTQALMEPRVQAAGYPDERAVASQHYADFPWRETVDLWASMNRLLIHVLQRVPSDRWALTCRIGGAEPIPLTKLIEVYVEHCRNILGRFHAVSDRAEGN